MTLSALKTEKRNSWSNELIYDVYRYISQTVNVGFSCTVISTFDGVVEQTINAVPVILIILSGIDPTLCSN